MKTTYAASCLQTLRHGGTMKQMERAVRWYRSKMR